jgi:hypothetical protein
MTRRLIDCVKHSNLELAHHRAFWEAVEKHLPAGALENNGELGGANHTSDVAGAGPGHRA